MVVFGSDSEASRSHATGGCVVPCAEVTPGSSTNVSTNIQRTATPFVARTAIVDYVALSARRGRHAMQLASGEASLPQASEEAINRDPAVSTM
jgi:hypothetical protein